ncbi:MAG: ABC transporter permease subunit [Gemmatimonadetes bacterium]|nr:ABC transporter permease subunit [Gemmatimonadota bacterium]
MSVARVVCAWRAGRAGRATLAALAFATGAAVPALSELAAQDSRDRARDAPPVVVASKPFGESYLLAEMFAQLLESAGLAVTRRPGLGATEIAFTALRTDAIDVYPEYTGTGLVAVLRDSVTEAMRRDPRLAFDRVSREFPARFGVRWLPPLGFQNGYAIAVRRETAERLQLRTLSDVARRGRDLRAGFTSDFIGRGDGFAGLASAYGLAFKSVRPLAPAVKYEALATASVDIIDGYSTDGLLAKFDLVALDDDLHFFPPYEAAALVSPRLSRERPDAIAALARLSGRLTEADVREWNRRVEVVREPVATVARDALASLALAAPGATDLDGPVAEGTRGGAGFAEFFWARRLETLRLAGEHSVLVLVALAAAILLAVPLGVVLARVPGIAEGVMQVLGVLQTIPSIALLAFMIPLLGIGARPALVALWLYALLPIVRATYTGVHHADPDAVGAAEALGTTAWQRLWWVQVPLAAPVVLAGVRTAAVITVGAATLAAFIGAGGLGEPIVTGLGLADTRLVLSGAIPAALLAVIVDLALAGVERVVGPAHRRARRPQSAD